MGDEKIKKAEKERAESIEKVIKRIDEDEERIQAVGKERDAAIKDREAAKEKSESKYKDEKNRRKGKKGASELNAESHRRKREADTIQRIKNWEGKQKKRLKDQAEDEKKRLAAKYGKDNSVQEAANAIQGRFRKIPGIKKRRAEQEKKKEEKQE